jgi:hypothetical protein
MKSWLRWYFSWKRIEDGDWDVDAIILPLLGVLLGLALMSPIWITWLLGR